MFEELKSVAAAAESTAVDMGLTVVVSVVDVHGNPALLHRMTGAPMHSLEMAFRKAYTAATFNVATAELTDKVQPGGPLYGLAVNSGSKLIGFGGGAPFVVSSGERFGLGISGGTTEEDIEIMQSALDQQAAAR
ncbi:MAG: heme-binding protein [Microcella sp.]|uniref:GlcG/HbpS family heme-binding protein n=1 Tax=Microcella sp. TaxID=1913979 RepID=UPI003314E666